jgi:hypothetical protein
VGALLNDTLLMRDMLVAGGPAWGSKSGGPAGQYGPAMAIYAAINASSAALAQRAPPAGAPWDDRDQTTVLRRLALGTALANAVPIATAFVGNGSTVDPVARYLQFEAAYLAGDLDPAFEVLTVFECALVADADAFEEDLRWLRETMANYRPDYIAMDYSWRYIQVRRARAGERGAPRAACAHAPPPSPGRAPGGSLRRPRLPQRQCLQPPLLCHPPRRRRVRPARLFLALCAQGLWAADVGRRAAGARGHVELVADGRLAHAAGRRVAIWVLGPAERRRL